MAWYSEGELTSPADGALLATTGKLAVGNNSMTTVIVSATVAAAVRLLYRNAADSASKQGQTIRVVANSTVVVPLGAQVVDIGDALQVVTVGAILGAVQASIVY